MTSLASPVVSVSALVGLLQDLIEENFVEVMVQGELASLARPGSGHIYFTLKDDQAQLRCAMFRGQVRALRFDAQSGMEMICRGRVSLYPQRGDLQLIVESMEPVGIGSLQLAFQQLKDKLEAEGLFSVDRKRPLPDFPRTIGVVTSATGAAIHDILQVLRRRAAGVRVLVFPVPVQGEGAAAKIASAIEDLNAEGSCDVLIVGRGGGSQEDLWAFNEELLARAITGSKIPIISAVGHEVDVSIADLVADLRAATPSAAAELVVRNRFDLERHVDQLCLRFAGQMRWRLDSLRSSLNSLGKRLRSPEQLVQRHLQQTIFLESRLQAKMEALQGQAEHRFSQLTGRLEALSPLSVLRRGYAIVYQEPAAKIVNSADQLAIGDRLRITLARGSVRAQVSELCPGEDDL